MNVYEMQKREPKQLHQLVSVWKDSVRTMHLFLSDAEIEKIQTYVPSALHDIEHLIVAEKIRAAHSLYGDNRKSSGNAFPLFR